MWKPGSCLPRAVRASVTLHEGALRFSHKTIEEIARTMDRLPGGQNEAEALRARELSHA
jgi:hypothetical protein